MHAAALMPYRYRPEVLEQLLLHGARPTADTPPELVHDVPPFGQCGSSLTGSAELCRVYGASARRM